MSQLWTPEAKPPLLRVETKEKVVTTLLDHGLWGIWKAGCSVLGQEQPVLKPFISNFTLGEASPEVSDSYNYAERTFRIASVVTAFAYHEDGFDAEITDDIFRTALLDAEFEGVPEVYVARYYEDSELRSLLDFVMETPEMQDHDNGDYEGALRLGAGVVRHYTSFAMAV